jgi:hypothetical protein
MKNLFYRRRFALLPLGIAAFIAIIGYVVMTLWNQLLPSLLHVTTITFWQAVGIFILCKILFDFKQVGPPRGAYWMRHKLADRFKHMTPEERARFKEKWASCGGWNKWDMDDKSEVLSPEPKAE